MKTEQFFSILCILFCFFLNAQNKNIEDKPLFSPTQIWESGLPYTAFFSQKDYKGNSQNWGFAEGNDNIIYIANSEGVLEYDGKFWRNTPLKNNSIVFSIAKSNDGLIYVGGVGEFGYIKRDSIGQSKYHSLSEKLDQNHKKFTRISSIVSLNNKVFFISSNFLFRWDGKKFKIWTAKDKFGNVFIANKNIYVTSKGEGVLELKNEKLQPIPNGNYFSNKKGRIMMIESFKKDKLLIGHSTQGLFVYNGKTFEVFNTKIQEVFKKNTIYTGSSIKNGDYALTTLNSGVYILNGKTRTIKRRYGKNNGLLSDVVYVAYSDASGGLWIGGEKGIARIDLSSSFRKFNTIAERVRSIIYDKNTLYVASKGVFYLSQEKTKPLLNQPYFKTLKGIDQAVRFIIPVGTHKLILQNSKVFDVDKDNNITLIQNNQMHTYALKSKIKKNTVYVSTQEGNIKEFTLFNDKWTSKNIYKTQHEVSKITENYNGDLWFSTYNDGIYKLKKTTIKSSKPLKLIKYDTVSNLPSLNYNFVFNLNKNIYVSNQEQGIYILDTITQIFSRDTTLMKQFTKEKVDAFGPMSFETNNSIWQTVNTDKGNKIYNYNQKYISELLEYNVYRDFKTYSISAFDNIVMFSGPDGMLAYNNEIKRENIKITNVQIRKVLIKNDSLVYAGGINKKDNVFKYKSNDIQFEYSLPFYTKSQDNEYQFILEGFDESWSSWSNKNQKNYTNIPEGDYIFKVRSKNIFNQISKEANYTFTVSPPWYRTWWMYIIYAIGIFTLIALITQWRSNQLLKKNKILENLIKERTSEIVQKNIQLKDQTEQLKVVDKMKTRLFANISHEFRTPLTLIKGPIEQLEQNPKKKLSISNVKMIRRNANRLLKLVNQLLDLSKLESGNLELEPSEGNVYKCIRVAASTFSSHAAQRNMDYQIKIPPNKILWASFDRDKLEKIIYNLLSNAFKFTDDDDTVSISVKFSKEQLKIEVADSGCGIPPDRLAFIFDRFFQVDDSFTKEKEGTGIGLSLTKELVELMKGTIHVESEYKKGSVFKIIIPLEEIKTVQKEDEEEFNIKINKEEASITIKPQNKNLHTILIVEDNKDMRDFIKQQLEDEYQIIEAYNGQDGLEKASKIMPDLIITDLMMPKMDGISLCKQLKKEINTSHIPVIMLTAKAGIENKIEGLETGADDYLTKPFNSKELHARIKNLIEQRQKLRELFSKKDIVNPKEVTVTSLDEQFLQKIIDLLEAQYSNPEFAIPQMREELAMSNAQLHRKMKALTNQSPGGLLRNFRLKRAAQILKQKGAYVTEVAYDVGFSNLSYFAKCFKEFHGVSPSVFSKKNSNS